MASKDSGREGVPLIEDKKIEVYGLREELSVRAKVVKKTSHRERYGHVGTVVRTHETLTHITVWVKFDDGVTHTFDEKELRMGVKASG